MTTPNLDNILPYGATFAPTVGAAPLDAVTSHPKLNGNRYLRVGPGPVFATFTWDGAEACWLYLRRDGKLILLEIIPEKSGGGLRSAKSVRFGALEGDMLYLYLRPNHVATTTPPTASIEVIPTYSG